ncbi:MAG: cobyric acid synthase [Acidimicrobiales bacterium]
MRGALMVCGTGSDVGKTSVVTGLCRLLHRRGVSVAPFKAQNMALNSYVTPSGHEIGRAQGIQAVAAGVEPEVAMNPVLLKPTGERTSQVVVMGRPVDHLDAAGYQEAKAGLWPIVLEALADLRRRYDVVILEGAGSAAEINLLDADIVNLRVAAAAGVPAIVVGDIDRGGVFASLFGTVALLPDHLRPLVKGFVVNKLRGDPALLADGPAELERRSGVPTLGVLPYVHGLEIDTEDSLGLPSRAAAAAAASVPDRHAPEQPVHDGAVLDVVVVRLPRIANFTDADALAVEPGVRVRFAADARSIGAPDLVVLPGTKATVADLEWLRGNGIDRAIHASGALVLGVCGGYQMMGLAVTDEVESGRGRLPGLGWLPVETVFGADKLTRQRRGTADGLRVCGYEIRHGRVSGSTGWIRLDDGYGAEPEGARDLTGRFWGTSLHGILEEDGFRSAFLAKVAGHRGGRFVPSGASFALAREDRIDRLADMLESHLDMSAIEILVKSASEVAP